MSSLKTRIETLQQNILLAPKDINRYIELANVYAQSKLWGDAANVYLSFVKVIPKHADSYFNAGYYQSKAGQYQAAVDYYLKALELSISQPEEVHLNIANIYSEYLRKEDLAQKHLCAALKIKPNYISALYNLANIYEDDGCINQAIELFNKILVIDRTYYNALARIAQLTKVQIINDEIITKLMQCEPQCKDLQTKINVNFALGKVFNDVQEFDKAFAYYQQANSLNKRIVKTYDKKHQEQTIQNQIDTFNQQWFKELSNDIAISTAEPIFICGMFRSGSTLAEQILAAHPNITAGGEREFLVRNIETLFPSLSQDVLKASRDTLTQLACLYLEDLHKAFPNASIVTDKRPDNFLYIGLIKTMFPKARFIHTQRNALDNCLSVYFLQLGQAMNYAVELADIAHYYQQQEKLMAHWKLMFAEDVYTFNYDDMLKEPELHMRSLVRFLGQDWSTDCLNFDKLTNQVKTASVWQVRQPLYSSSSGRWKHYAKQLNAIAALTELPSN